MGSAYVVGAFVNIIFVQVYLLPATTAYFGKMDPRTGSFGESKQPRRPNGAKSAAKAGKLKSVTLSVEWGYEIHRLTIGPRNWMKIQAGKAWGTRGETYYYEGERFSCYWHFNERGKPGSLVVSYGNDGGEGYVGTWAGVHVTEEYQVSTPPVTTSLPTVDLNDLPDVDARRQAVADDLAKKGRAFAEIDGQELADLLEVTPGEAGDRIHLCAIDEDETAQWLQESLSQGEGDGSVLLEKILSATRRKKLRRYLDKVEEGEDVDDFAITPRELKQLAPLRAQLRLEEGEIDHAWSYDDAVAPDGTKLCFTFAIEEDGLVEGCLATPYDGRLEPDPKLYAWE